MAGRKVGTVFYKRELSPLLTIFRIKPEAESRFPPSKAGQYIALRRDDCHLTKKIATTPDGAPLYGPDLDESGKQKIGPVTHSYSIASAPWEQEESGYLEFYVVLDSDHGMPGRLSSVLRRVNPASDNQVSYFDRITGSFTLDERAASCSCVCMVASGTGVAPFIAMIKQLHYDADHGRRDNRRYTLVYGNRTYEELAYHQEFVDIVRAASFDFVYVPTISRPTQRDLDDHAVGTGRANNVLRHVFGLPMKEEEALEEAKTGKGDLAKAVEGLKRTPKPQLPGHMTAEALRARLDPAAGVIMSCGNPDAMADIELTADRNQLRFEKEEW